MERRIRASTVVIHRGKLLCVRLADPLTGNIATYIPGGKVEPGETPARAAIRECLEESGYRISADEGSELVERYPFTFGGVVYDCTTHFFRGVLIDPEQPPDSVGDATYHHGVLWVPVSDIAKHFSFHPLIMSCVLKLSAI